MVEAAASMAARDNKRNVEYADGVDEETMKIINHFNATFPQSVSGVGLMSESDLTSGAGNKREFCEIDGLRDATDKEDLGGREGFGGGGGGAAKKISKSSLIIDLTRTAVQHHEENMAFNKSSFEYMKETRKEDVTRREEKDTREVEYRDKRDNIEQQRYVAEQTRLAESRQDNISMQNTFANILEGLLKKMN